MRFFKLIKYDLTYGIFNIKNLIKILILISLFTVACFEFNGRLLSYGQSFETDTNKLGDFFFIILFNTRCAGDPNIYGLFS